MKKHGFSFSWKRATGISSAKQKISRATGIPLTKSGRRQKAGNVAGCLIQVFTIAIMVAVLAALSYAQETEWMRIDEMSGEKYSGHPIETLARGVARSDDYVKITIRFESPKGLPALFNKNLPRHIDSSEVRSVEARFEFNCQTSKVKVTKDASTVYLFNGKSHKSRESTFKVADGHIFAMYFCERPAPKSSGPPRLKP